MVGRLDPPKYGAPRSNDENRLHGPGLLPPLPAWANPEWVHAQVMEIEAEKPRLTLQHEHIKMMINAVEQLT